jgi:cholesterol transport system auxiliary component
MTRRHAGPRQTPLERMPAPIPETALTRPTKRLFRRPLLAAALASLALSGCTSILAGGAPPLTYDLTAPTDLRASGGAQRGNLVIGEPAAVSVINGQRIVVKPGGGEVTYLPNAQWSDRLPALVQARMIEAYENASRLKSVGRPGDRLTTDYQLVTEIRAFEVRPGSAEVAVELTAKIVNDKTGRIVAAEVFIARRPGGTVDGKTSTLALNAAFGDVLRGLVAWTARQI